MPETQTLDISGLPEVVEAVNEVQVVDVIPAIEGYVSEYRLGLHGVYTGLVLFMHSIV